MTSEIAKYVSNTDRDVYTVSAIPEEVIAVIFAYVSRSPKGFRENIGAVIEEEQHGRERAAKFHEKWVLNYGHSSVAEHACVHVGVERVSRLFSSLLELSNEYLSFTEYSQRYQKPQRGDFYVPPELDDSPELKNEYVELNNYLYDAYSKLNDGLLEHLIKTTTVPEGKKESVHHRALEKLAFEDARYALGLATLTNLGMTGNARALEDSLSKLLSSPYFEVRTRAEEIKTEVRVSVPTLVKYANANPYLTQTRAAFEHEYRSSAPPEPERVADKLRGGVVNLIDWTGKNTDDPQQAALEAIVGSALFGYSGLSYSAVKALIHSGDPSRLLELFKKSVEALSKFDNPINALKSVKYRVEFTISEACWHQLLRHRKVTWITQAPSARIGVEIPPRISEAGIEDLLVEAAGKSERLHEKLIGSGFKDLAAYVVTNAHLRRVVGDFDLWELYHLVNIRMSKGAQWDIQKIVKALADEVSLRHPDLVRPALKRVDK